uniref:Uncharacterized protein n=1 Tax=Manihot esculenta TaxID=3983 RepID=A0A2C9V6V8_MANES
MGIEGKAKEDDENQTYAATECVDGQATAIGPTSDWNASLASAI